MDKKVKDNLEKYPPGSYRAGVHGCTCPVLDNHYGDGAYINQDGDKMYYISADCELHICPAVDDAEQE
jgi:hypothetical protein